MTPGASKTAPSCAQPHAKPSRAIGYPRYRLQPTCRRVTDALCPGASSTELQNSLIWKPHRCSTEQPLAFHNGGSSATAAISDDYGKRPALQSRSEPSA